MCYVPEIKVKRPRPTIAAENTGATINNHIVTRPSSSAAAGEQEQVLSQKEIQPTSCHLPTQPPFSHWSAQSRHRRTITHRTIDTTALHHLRHGRAHPPRTHAASPRPPTRSSPPHPTPHTLSDTARGFGSGITRNRSEIPKGGLHVAHGPCRWREAAPISRIVQQDEDAAHK